MRRSSLLIFPILIATALVVSACSSDPTLMLAETPDVFHVLDVETFVSSTAYTYSFQAPGGSGSIGSISSASHTAQPRRTRVVGEVNSLGEITEGELLFLEDGTALSRTGVGPYVNLPGVGTIDDATWIGPIYQAVSAVADQFEYVGDSTISGISAERYRGPVAFPSTIDPLSLAANLGLATPFRGATDIWVDTNGLIVAYSVEASADEDNGFLTVTIDFRVDQIGSDFEIAVPDIGTIIPPEVTADERAKTHLRNVLLAAQLYATGDESYRYLSVEALEAREPSVAYVTDLALAGNGDTVGFLAEDQRLLLVTRSESGKWYCIAHDRQGDPTVGMGTSLEEVDSHEECSAISW